MQKPIDTFFNDTDDTEETKLQEVNRENPGKEFLDFAGYEKVRKLRKNGDLDKAEMILKKAMPVPAVGDELRKVLSAKAMIARKANNWQTVIACFESYLKYKKENDAVSRKIVNADIPDLPDREKKWLEEAKKKLNK